MSIEEKSLNFLAELSKSIRSMKMYGSGHPAVAREVGLAFDHLKEVFATLSTLVIGRKDGVLILQEKPVKLGVPGAEKFMDLLEDRSIQTFAIQKGIDAEELRGFVEKVAKRVQDNEDPVESLSMFSHIEVNSITYRAMKEGEAVIDLGEASASPSRFRLVD